MYQAGRWLDALPPPGEKVNLIPLALSSSMMGVTSGPPMSPTATPRIIAIRTRQWSWPCHAVLTLSSICRGTLRHQASICNFGEIVCYLGPYSFLASRHADSMSTALGTGCQFDSVRVDKRLPRFTPRVMRNQGAVSGRLFSRVTPCPELCSEPSRERSSDTGIPSGGTCQAGAISASGSKTKRRFRNSG